jgi:hypothetical protein
VISGAVLPYSHPTVGLCGSLLRSHWLRARGSLLNAFEWELLLQNRFFRNSFDDCGRLIWQSAPRVCPRWSGSTTHRVDYCAQL